MEPSQSKILDAAARKFLRPIGVKQKGRSRIWYDDCGSWITVVEFQPSSWDKGSYLNVGAMWLWYEKDYFSFDDGYRVAQFSRFQNEAQFSAIANSLAEQAATEVQAYRLRFSSVDAVASHLIAKSPKGFWDYLHAGIACALSGRESDATRFFGDVAATEETAEWIRNAKATARQHSALLNDHSVLEQHIREIVRRTRRVLKLDERSDFSFSKQA